VIAVPILQRLALPLLALASVAALGCQPRTTDAEIQARQRHPLCYFEPLGDATIESALFEIGHGGGLIAGARPAKDHTVKQTKDGYLVRGFASSLVMALALLGLGALAAALVLTLGQRRPTARWAERLVQSLASEIDRLRALGKSGDAVSKAIVERFEEPLTTASARAQKLLARAIPLTRRDGAPTAKAHLESLHTQLEGLLALVERAHLQVLVWQERQHQEERSALEAQIDQVIGSLKSALDEVKA
jgi:hypothetical protein